MAFLASLAGTKWPEMQPIRMHLRSVSTSGTYRRRKQSRGKKCGKLRGQGCHFLAKAGPSFRVKNSLLLLLRFASGPGPRLEGFGAQPGFWGGFPTPTPNWCGGGAEGLKKNLAGPDWGQTRYKKHRKKKPKNWPKVAENGKKIFLDPILPWPAQFCSNSCTTESQKSVTLRLPFGWLENN